MAGSSSARLDALFGGGFVEKVSTGPVRCLEGAFVTESLGFSSPDGTFGGEGESMAAGPESPRDLRLCFFFILSTEEAEEGPSESRGEEPRELFGDTSFPDELDDLDAACFGFGA